MSTYVIRGGHEGKARLQILASALWPTTLSLLNNAGIQQGMACLDVGCGGGDVALQMARLAGPSGRVTGIDMDGTKIELAKQDAVDQQLSNVKFLKLNIDDFQYENEFDLVYARFLLTHLRDPLKALEMMVKATKPGGIIVVEDIDHSGIFSYPEYEPLKKYVSLYNQVVRLKGGDPEIGPRLPALFTAAGLQDPHLSHVQPAYITGDAKRMHQITLENIAPALISSGLALEEEITALSKVLGDFVDDKTTIASLPRIFQLWARRE